MRHALCQVLKHGDEPSDCESSCPCYYSQIEGLGLHVVNIRVWARPRHCANPALQLKLPLKKTAKGTILSPSKFREKNSKGSTHEDIYFSTEIARYNRTWKVFKGHSKVRFQSRSTEHVRLMLNQAWWMHLAIVNMSHRKCVRTLESFFAPNQSQSESEKMILKKNSVLIRKKQMRIEGNRKNHEITRGCATEKEAMCCYFCRKSKKTKPFASAEGCTNLCPPKNKNVNHNFS